MATPNAEIANRAIRHAIGLQLRAAGIAVELLEIYDLSIQEIASIMATASGGFDPQMTAFLLEQVQDQLRGRYSQAAAALRVNLTESAEHEAGFQDRMVSGPTAALGIVWAGLTTAEIAKAARVKLEDLTVLEWARDLERQQVARVRRLTREAARNGETNLAEQITGPKSPLRKGRAHFVSWIKTFFAQVTQGVREVFFDKNPENVDWETWSSILDSHTTKFICFPRHGKRYRLPGHIPVGHSLPWGPGPGLIHRGCRSVSISSIRGGGPVPQLETPDHWVDRQPRSVLDDLFGVGRAELFVSGGLTARGLVSATGRAFTLQELQAVDG